MRVRFFSVVAVAVLVVFGVCGCRSTPKIDWNSRVGNYTYDQAVVELGPPDKSARLENGHTVADWITRRRGGTGLSIGTGVFGGHGGVSVGQSIGTGPGDRVLRLVFDENNRLISATGGR